MAKLLKGKKVADAIIKQCKVTASAITKQTGRAPVLAIVSVGQDNSNAAYIRGIKRAAGNAGVELAFHDLPSDCEQAKLEALINKLNTDDTVRGILPMRPFPKESNINEQAVCNKIAPGKDVDCVSALSAANAYAGLNGFSPCTAEACVQILKHYDVQLEGTNAVVVGRSLVVGKPVANLLLNENATVTVCHSKTQNLPEIVQHADVLVVAIGRAKMLDENCFKPGHVVIDAGINWDAEAGKLCGDVDFAAAEPIVDAITPVPGGVGAVTSAILIKHTLS